MKTWASGVVVTITLLASSLGAAGAFQRAAVQPVEKPFAKGGVIRMRLVAGDYRISGTSDDKIRISWRTDRAGSAENVTAEADIQGTSAVIRTRGSHNGLHFTIDVPSRSDLDIDLSAGDLDVRGVEGNKKVESWAGDMSIDIGQPDQYRDVEASVRAGDLTALPFKVSKGGLLRSFRWTGKGPYVLHAKLFAGDLTLR